MSAVPASWPGTIAWVVHSSSFEPQLMENLTELQKRIGLPPHDLETITEAVTHPSYIGEGDNGTIISNQRLEFLGDSVLGLVISEYLFKRHTKLAEGDLTKIKAVAVSEAVLHQAARELQLGDYLRLGKGEDASGGRARSSILADAFEALIGAIYLGHGLDSAREFILKTLGPSVAAIEERRHIPDHKSLLQEMIQSEGRGTPTYHVIATSGPDHNKRFRVEVRARHEALGQGIGSSKKEAEQQAAAHALASISSNPRSVLSEETPRRKRRAQRFTEKSS